VFPWQRFRHYIVGSDISTLTVQREGTPAFPWQQWLRERANVTLHVHLSRVFIEAQINA